MRAPSPMGPAGATSSPGMANKPRPRQSSLALSASGRPDSRSGPVPPGFQQGGPHGLMAPPPAPGHLPPGMQAGMSPGMAPGGLGGQMPQGYLGPGGQQMGPDATPTMLKQQGRRPSVAQDPSLMATPDNRRPSLVAPPGMDGAAASTPDPVMLAAASAAASQPGAQGQLIGSFGGAANAPGGRIGSQVAAEGLAVAPPMPGAPAQPDVPAQGEAQALSDSAAEAQAATGRPTTLAGGAPAFAQAVPSNLFNMPMLLGGPAPKESAVGTPITHFNTRVTKLDDAMRPVRAADAKGGAANIDAAKADEVVWTPLTADQEAELLGIMTRDLEHEKLFRQQQQDMEKSLKDHIDGVRPPRRKASDGTITKPKPLAWWERPEEEDISGLQRDLFKPFGVLFPDQKRAELEQGQRGSRPHIPLKRSLMESVAQMGEDLVPIRLEIDHEHWKLRDTFTWNAQDSHINVDAFARSICEDIGLPSTVFIPQIKEQMNAQILEHQTTSAFKAKPKFDFSVDAKEGKGSLKDEDLRWWSKWRRRVEHVPFGAVEEGSNDAVQDVGMQVDDSSEEDEARSEPPEMVDTTPAEELRMMVKLDITVGSMNLVDQFEWDANETDPAAAEKFAETFAADLGLSGEFKTAIAHSIREQVSVHVKSLAMTGHTFDGRPIADEELRAAFLGPVNKANLSRSELESYNFTPRLLQLTEAEIERLDREREREARRKRRQTRGRRGINLPDRDPQKTQRTPAVYGIQTAQTGADAALQNANGVSDRYGGMSTRRAAAAAANASIAPSQAVDVGTPTPGPDGLGLPDRKKPKVNHHAIHFDFPGGLGRKSDPGRPKFAPEYTEEEARKRARSPENQATGSQADKPTPKLVSLSYAQRNNVRPEDLERQHPNFHDGMWHCSNCGIPGTLAPGRRKGPLGDKSLCGPCGKYYHRHRKVIFLEYTRDPVFHMKQQQALNRKMGISNPLIDTALLNALGETEDSGEPTSAADTPKPDGTGGSVAGAGGNGVKRRGRPPGTSRAANRVDEEGEAGDKSDEEDLPFEMVGSPDDSDSSSRSSSPEAAPRSRKSASQSVAAGDESWQPARRAAAENAREKVSASYAATAGNEEAGENRSSIAAGAGAAVAPLASDGTTCMGGEVKTENADTNGGGDAAPTTSETTSLATGVAAGVACAAAPGATAVAGSPSTASISTPTLSNVSPRLASVAGAVPPEWLAQSGAALKARYPNDRFEIQQRPRPAGVAAPLAPEWRVRCLDCPGKLYTPGPDESLNNFEIHLRNRLHRANVNKRVYGNSGPPATIGGQSSPGGSAGGNAGLPLAEAGSHKSAIISHSQQQAS
nr:related to SNF5-component of SWI/SNF transcription activator complex [Melanopsichium pennsylvanicum 4]